MSTWNPKEPTVPVDNNGNWLSYPDYRHKGWELVHPFYAELEILSMYHGRSAKGLNLRDVNTGKEYPMFIGDLVDALKNGTFSVEQTEEGGRLKGWWTASKRGANYGLKAVKK